VILLLLHDQFKIKMKISFSIQQRTCIVPEESQQNGAAADDSIHKHTLSIHSDGQNETVRHTPLTILLVPMAGNR